VVASKMESVNVDSNASLKCQKKIEKKFSQRTGISLNVTNRNNVFVRTHFIETQNVEKRRLNRMPFTAFTKECSSKLSALEKKL